jgi:hypothetical protein
VVSVVPILRVPLLTRPNHYWALMERDFNEGGDNPAIVAIANRLAPRDPLCRADLKEL